MENLTSEYKRDPRSKALIASDEAELLRFNIQKKRIEKLKSNDTIINKLEEEIKQLKVLVETLIENNKHVD